MIVIYSCPNYSTPKLFTCLSNLVPVIQSFRTLPTSLTFSASGNHHATLKFSETNSLQFYI